VRYTARAPLRIDLGGTWNCLRGVADREEGFAVCVAIQQYAEGAVALPWGDGPLRSLRSERRSVEYSLRLPIGAGLGASAAQTVLWVALMRSVIDNAAEREDVARTACEIQRMLGTLESPQDAYASAHGGITCLAVSETVRSEHVALSLPVRENLADRLLLVWSGERGLSRSVAETLRTRVTEGDHATIEGLSALGRTAREMGDALRTGQIDALATLVDEHSRLQESMIPAAQTAVHRDLAQLARSLGATAYKPCGVAGGAAVIMVPQGEREYLTHKLSERRVRAIEAQIDTYGVHLRKA
jgi:galactokinase/mevalonate kinase-like predicted kinase